MATIQGYDLISGKFDNYENCMLWKESGKSLPKPKGLYPIYENIPDELKNRQHWVTWGFLLKNPPRQRTEGQIKLWTKMPHCKVNDSSRWLSFQEATYKYKSGYADGIGYVFHKDDEIVGIDLDGVIEANGEIDELAQVILSKANTFTELSPSQTGLHLYIKAQIPEGKRRGRIEMYSHGRFFTVTGHIPHSCEKRDVHGNQPLANVLFKYLTDNGNAKSLNKPQMKQPSYKSDDFIINRIFTFSKDTKFKDLYNGKWQKYNEYPSQSEADCGFMQKLLYWTNGDEAQAERIFRKSGLYRIKSDRDDYIKNTLKKASKCYGN